MAQVRLVFLYFEQFFNFFTGDTDIDYGARANNANVFRLIEAFRKHGHKCSKINPVPVRTVPG